MAKTPQELLEQVDYAISAITKTGQSVTIGDKTVTRANLTELRNWRNQLMNEANADNSGLLQNTSVCVFDTR